MSNTWTISRAITRPRQSLCSGPLAIEEAYKNTPQSGRGPLPRYPNAQIR
jgi:hypothetical protein